MPNNHDLQPLLDTQQNQLNLVFSDSNGIDAKVLAVIGANVAALLFVDDAKVPVGLWHFSLIYLPFILSLLLDILSVWPRKYLGASADITSAPEYMKLTQEALVLRLLADTIDAIKHNSQINKNRLRQCNASLLLTALGFLGLLFII
ncbi:MAG TPA: hypothetical protein VGG13_01960 [Candidatus Saccharimonadales bacterium]|jgi:hypothetical protein